VAAAGAICLGLRQFTQSASKRSAANRASFQSPKQSL
jgi:hypothetical protein